MAKVQARTLKGFRDYLPEVEIPRQVLLRKITDVFESFGFSPLTTPAIEYSEVLLGKYGTEGDKLLYRFEDNGARDVALRYDLTVPLARVVAQHGQLPRPFKRYQIAPVWRAEKPARGRFREFTQCDIDIVGEASMRADAECVMVGLELLAALGVPAYEIRVNNRRILDGMLERVGLTDPKVCADSLRTIDKLDKIGREGVVAELKSAAGLDDATIEGLFTVLEMKVDCIADLAQLDALFADIPSGLEGVAQLRELLQIVRDAGYKDNVAVDLSIARGLDYYTGTIYETFVIGRENFGAVMSGGRYDDLLGMFLKQSVPAVGICLGIDRLISVLADLELLGTRGGVADVYMVLFDGDDYGKGVAFARELRAAGIRVESALSPARLGKQFKQAEKRGCRWAVIAGASELAEGKITVKDLTTGNQETLNRDVVPGWLSEQILGR